MKTLLCMTTPYLRIYNPVTGDYAQFVGGKLVLEDDDPNYEVVIAESIRNPAISVLEMLKGGISCPECGQAFAGTASAAHLGVHRKSAHFSEWLADKEAADKADVNVILKERAGIACDVCVPAQVFPDDNALGEHIRMLHLAPGDEALDAVTARRPGEVDPK